MTVLNLDAHQLIIFYYVASEESVTIAAEKLCLTQPTVTYHLKSLERYAGVKLFKIKKQKFCLTEAGQGLFKYAKTAWAQLNGADRYLQMLKQTHICVGVSPLLHSTVASVLTRIAKSYPEVNLQIVTVVSNQILQEVSDMEINVGVIVRTEYKDFNVKVQEISKNERLIFAASPGIPIAKKERVEWHDLENFPLILGPQGSIVRPIVAGIFKSAGILTPPRFAVETLNIDSGKIFAQEGNGVGVWRIKDVESEVLAGKLMILPVPEDIFIGVDLILPRDMDPVPSIIAEFIQQIKEEFHRPSLFEKEREEPFRRWPCLSPVEVNISHPDGL